MRSEQSERSPAKGLAKTGQNVKRKINAKQAGFTLVEMLVIIAIIGLLAVIAVANFSGAESRNNLMMEAERFSGTFREAKNYAISQKRVEDPVSGLLVVPDGGFGVWISLDSPLPAGEYLIFGNIDTSDDYGPGDWKRFEEFLPDVELESIVSAEGEDLSSAVIITMFSPPSGNAYFAVDGAEYETDYIAYNLKEEGTDGAERCVVVHNRTGATEIFNGSCEDLP